MAPNRHKEYNINMRLSHIITLSDMHFVFITKNYYYTTKVNVFLHPTYRAIRNLSSSQKIFNNISYQRCSFFVYFAQNFVVKKINNDLGRSTRCYVWTFYSFCSEIVGKKAVQKWQKSKLRKCTRKQFFFY